MSARADGLLGRWFGPRTTPVTALPVRGAGRLSLIHISEPTRPY